MKRQKCTVSYTTDKNDVNLNKNCFLRNIYINSVKTLF